VAGGLIVQVRTIDTTGALTGSGASSDRKRTTTSRAQSKIAKQSLVSSGSMQRTWMA
jgi:hypothetical protein